MSVNTQKMSNFPESHFKIIAYCKGCGVRHIISQDQYPDMSINDIYSTLSCPTCNKLGLSSSVVIKN